MENESIKERANSRNSTQVRESKKMVRHVMDSDVDLAASLLTRLAPQKAASSVIAGIVLDNSSIGDRLLFVVHMYIYMNYPPSFADFADHELGPTSCKSISIDRMLQRLIESYLVQTDSARLDKCVQCFELLKADRNFNSTSARHVPGTQARQVSD